MSRDRYHHGDLPAKLVDAAVALIGERGVRGFSLAQASRRLGVSPSAPYRHFRDRDHLLAAVAVRGYQALGPWLASATAAADPPADQLAAVASGFVRFSAENPAVFETLFSAGLDPARHPDLARAHEPIGAAFLGPATAVDPEQAEALALAIVAVARGYANLLLDGAFGSVARPVDEAAARAAAAATAVVRGWRAPPTVTAR